ncbi:UNVERIFIED_CONTAM: hypothetical protein Slati_2198900 [Sesamum latifolium]|uniref:Uncharacterized protein n=1 Tax=Sesamum latifolium TaxID=2727402 RepID=A0AAW2WSD2_9LAMI
MVVQIKGQIIQIWAEHLTNKGFIPGILTNRCKIHKKKSYKENFQTSPYRANESIKTATAGPTEQRDIYLQTAHRNMVN